MRTLWGRIAGLAFVMACVVLVIPPAQAVPNFASQTGQPCTACHIGGYGPQLTPLGRAFKIGGYTQRGGEGWESYVPLSAMVLTSFTNTGSGVAGRPDHAALRCQQQFRTGPDQRVPRRRHRRAHRRLRAVHLFQHPERVERSITPTSGPTRRHSTSAATSCASAPPSTTIRRCRIRTTRPSPGAFPMLRRVWRQHRPRRRHS